MWYDILFIAGIVIFALWMGNWGSSCILSFRMKEIWDNHPEDLPPFLRYRKWMFGFPIWLFPVIALEFILIWLGILVALG
jgi:hypothetical protein